MCPEFEEKSTGVGILRSSAQARRSGKKNESNRQFNRNRFRAKARHGGELAFVAYEIVRWRKDKNPFNALAEMGAEVAQVTGDEVRRACLDGRKED
jgi:hypothetical protein